MPTNNIGWDESKPANTDDLGDGDDEIRSFKTAVRTGLSAEHLWPSSSGAAGAHLLGSARVYVGARSAVSSDGTTGRLMLETDSYSLWGDGAGTSMTLLGHQLLLINRNVSGALNAPAKHAVAVQFGLSTTTPSGVTRITYAGSGFSGVPIVLVTSQINGFYAGVVQSTSGSTGFTAFGNGGGTGAAASVDIAWLSIGTVHMGVP